MLAELPDGSRAAVVVRVPQGYDPSRPWPLLIVLHGTGGSPRDLLPYYERLLGDRLEEFILAAPDQYREMIFYDNRWPPLGEHDAIRAALKRRFHVDSDRVYVSGYSRGGHATWLELVQHADQYAAGVALAGTFVLPEPDELWPAVVPNTAHVRLVNVWGRHDTAGPGGGPSRQGGIAGLNMRLYKLSNELDLDWIMVEMADEGHSGIFPPPDQWERALAQQRVHAPRRFRHAFRHEMNARAYWLEGDTWVGTQWTDKVPEVSFRDGEDPGRRADVSAAFGRAYRGALGQLQGEIDGQTIRVSRRRVRNVTVWFGPGMIDWDEPVEIKVSGRTLFEGMIERNLGVCLREALRTRDFDRLRYAGVRFRGGNRGRPVE